MLAPYLPGFILRRLYSSQKLAEYIKIAVCDDRRGVFLNGGDIPEASIFLLVTNLSPFPVAIETLWCELRFLGGRIARLASKLRQEVEAHNTAIVNLEGSLTAPQRDFIAQRSPEEMQRYLKDRQLSVYIEAELSCQVRRFQLYGRDLTTANVEVVNFGNVPSGAATSASD